MTREEALKVLYGIRNLNYREWWDKECDEAIDIAIEALSAVTADVYKAHEEEHLKIVNRIKELQYAIAKTQTIVGKMVESAEAEWIFNPTDAIDLMFAKPKCSKCGFESSDGGNFCPNCGADMKGGAK